MENQPTPELDLRRYLDIMRRRKWVIGLVMVVVIGLAVGFSTAQDPVYEAEARVLLQPGTVDNSDTLGAGAGQVSPEAVATEIQVMESQAVEAAVQEDLGRLPDVSFEAVDTTAVVAITASAGTAERAAEDANGYADGYIRARREVLTVELTQRSERLGQEVSDLNQQLVLAEAPVQAIEDQLAALPPEDPTAPPSPERQSLLDARDQVENDTLDERTSLQARILTSQQDLDRVESALAVAGTVGAEVLAPASAPTSPVSPKPLRNGLLAAAIGLVMGVFLALVLEVLDDRIRHKEHLAAATGGRSVVGLIPSVSGWRDRKQPRVISIEAPTSPAAEAYRTLRTSLHFLALDDPVRLIQVTSANAGEGKTTTVANLGVALARAGRRVIVVCCDLRRPRIHHFYGVDNAIGFTSVLLGEADLEDALQQVDGEPRLQILASGPPPPNPAELLSTRRTHDLLKELAELADVVLIDTPPVLPVTDSLLVSGMVDITVMVSRAGSTNKRAARRAVELLDQVDAKLAGTVLNGAPLDGDHGYGYGYGEHTYGPSRPDGRERKKLGRSAPKTTAEQAG